MTTFPSVSAFRKFVQNSPEFKPTQVSKTKLLSPQAFSYKESQQVVFGFDDEQTERVEIAIINPLFTITPTTGTIRQFSPNILERLESRDKLVEADLLRAGNVMAGPGWIMKPTQTGMFVFVSVEVTPEAAQKIRSILES